MSKMTSKLITALMNEDINLADKLINEGADINGVDGIGETPLYAVACYGVLPSVRYLIKRGANIHSTNRDGETALGIAAWNRHVEVARLLIHHGAKPDYRSRPNAPSARTMSRWVNDTRGDGATRQIFQLIKPPEGMLLGEYEKEIMGLA